MTDLNPVIFSKTEKPSLFKKKKPPLFGLCSPDGLREIVPAEYQEIRKFDGLYFAARRGFRWHCIDSEGRELVLYRMREGMEEGEVSSASTLAYCGCFWNLPVFIDGLAAVSTFEKFGESTWNIIDASGRVLLCTGSDQPVMFGRGFFAVSRDGLLSVQDVSGRHILRFPDPSPIADLIPGPVQIQDGWLTIREYKVHSDEAMKTFLSYLARFKSECGLFCTGTENVQTLNSDGVSVRRFALSFAAPPAKEDCLRLHVDVDNSVVFFSISAPCAAAPNVLPGKRLLLDAHTIYNLFLYSHDQFLPSDITYEELTRWEDETFSPTDSAIDESDCYGPYCEGYTRE